MVKIDSTGKQIWSMTYGGTTDESACSVVLTSDGGYALAGSSGSDSWLVKTDSNGNQLWDRTFQGGVSSMVKTTDGGYALAGSSGGDAWLIKFDTIGNIVWTKTFGGTNQESAISIVQTSDDGYALAGSSVSNPWLLKVAADKAPSTINDYVETWRTTDFTVKLSAIDDFSSIHNIYYRINDGSINNLNANGQPMINMEGLNNKLEYWSEDDLGHEEAPHNILTGLRLDKTSPTGSIIINDGDSYTSSKSVTLTLTSNDLTSGVSQLRYSNDATTWSSWQSVSSPKPWTLDFSDGVKTVYYQILDKAGLLSSIYSDTINLDTTPPTGSISINDGATSSSNTLVTLSLTFSDPTSGVSQVRYSNDGLWDTEVWEPTSATHSWTLTSGQGMKTVYYQIKDNSGLTSLTYLDTITLQETTPTPGPTSDSTPMPSPTPTTTPTSTPTPTSSPAPIASPTSPPSPSPTPALTIIPTATPENPTISPSPAPSLSTSPSTSPSSQLTETPLYLYAAIVLAISAISISIISLIIKKRH